MLKMICLSCLIAILIKFILNTLDEYCLIEDSSLIKKIVDCVWLVSIIVIVIIN